MSIALVVDDVALNREILADILEDRFTIVEAADGEEALEILDSRHEEISVILLDLMMPKVDGLTVLGRINQSSYANRIPVLIITGDQNADIEERCLVEGATDFIKKPFNPTLVRQRIINTQALFSYKNHLEELVEEQTGELKKQAEDLARKNLILEKKNDDTIELMSSLVEARSAESGSHVRRVKSFTAILGKKVMDSLPEYGLTERELKLIVSASAMHDVGKISVSDVILNKPGKLTDEEFTEMKKHTVYGEQLLENVKTLWDEDYFRACRIICRSHHERWNGTGYPDRLKGDEIPIAAQIVAFADCFDALTTERVYKAAYSPEKAYEMICNGECGEFNPKLLDCFKACRESFVENVDSLKTSI